MARVVSSDAGRLPLRLRGLGAEAHEALDHFGDRREWWVRAASVHEDPPRGLEGHPLVGAQIKDDLDSHAAE
jgi:hypothetical protein